MVIHTSESSVKVKLKAWLMTLPSSSKKNVPFELRAVQSFMRNGRDRDNTRVQDRRERRIVREVRLKKIKVNWVRIKNLRTSFHFEEDE